MNIVWRIILNSIVLALINLLGILVAFGVYKIVLTMYPINQQLLQAPLAILLSAAFFVLWGFVIKRHLPKMIWQMRSEMIWIYLGAMIWGAALFVPLHYVSQGYMTSLVNIIVLWIFQVMVNVFVLLVTWIFVGPGDAVPEKR